MPIVRRAAWACWERIARRAARAYIAGPELADAMRVGRGLAARGFSATICPWDGPSDTPRQVADSYLAAMRELSGSSLDAYLSIKAPPLAFSEELVLELARAARTAHVGLHFDSLAPEHADRTWPLIRQVVMHGVPAGCTLPARWPRSLRDVDRALELGVRVRIVKGQWEDPDAPDIDVRRGFLSVISRLAGRGNIVAIATHDPGLEREALTRLRQKGTRCELELLFGLPTRSQLQVAKTMAVPVRFYIPYGHAWLPYGLSQLQRNPRILWWTARDWLLGWRPTRSVTLTVPASRARSSIG